MKLISIPIEIYEKYKLDMIFEGYKWDPQWADNNTIARYALILDEKEAIMLDEYTEKLSIETIKAENYLKDNLKLSKKLELPRQINKTLKSLKNYDKNMHIRLMRFDFHPVIDGGFSISEVNSDVPGGFAEASLMPEIAASLLNNENSINYYPYKNFGDILVEEIAAKTKPNGKIAMVHCTSYSDDRQVMQFIGDKLERLGYTPIYLAADHVNFKNQEAICALNGSNDNQVLNAIVRFTPLEWLIGIPKAWRGFYNTITASCNHPIAMFAQTKKFPFIWEELEQNGISLSTWRELLPDTINIKNVKNREGYIYKPALGRVGEGITIKEAISSEEYEKIMKSIRRNPKKYIAQKKFKSLPVETDDGKLFHVCLGVHSIEGKTAGFYARISKTPRIDSNALEAPVLVEGGK